MDTAELDLLTEALEKTMLTTSGSELDKALTALGWRDLLAESDEFAIATVFRLLGATGTHAPLINDVLLVATGQPPGGTLPLPYAGGGWVRWERDARAGTGLDVELPLVPTELDGADTSSALASGRRALGWWLVGTSRAMLALARAHALERTQFGKPLASFQAVRHRLAEALVAVEGAEATLVNASEDAGDADDELRSMLAKAAAGEAALATARHCQQVLGGMGFTDEHDLHRHIRRAYVLDGLLGSAKELTRRAGTLLRERGEAPRLAQL